MRFSILLSQVFCSSYKILSQFHFYYTEFAFAFIRNLLLCFFFISQTLVFYYLAQLKIVSLAFTLFKFFCTNQIL